MIGHNTLAKVFILRGDLNAVDNCLIQCKSLREQLSTNHAYAQSLPCLASNATDSITQTLIHNDVLSAQALAVDTMPVNLRNYISQELLERSYFFRKSGCPDISRNMINCIKKMSNGINPSILNRALLTEEFLESPKPSDIYSGVLVVNVGPESPAYLSGLRPTDILIQIDGINIDSVYILQRYLRSASPTRTVTIGYLRPGLNNKYEFNTTRVKLKNGKMGVSIDNF